MSHTMWNERYSQPSFAYGTEPNDFLVERLDQLPLGNALCLAEGRDVSITTLHADLKDFDPGSNQWDAVILIFCLLSAPIQRCVDALRQGGIMLLEAYTPKQLEFNTGGPPSADMMVDSGLLTNELAGLEIIHLQEKVREIHEGQCHDGKGAVVQILARKQ